jgi:cell wall-associated NlpC family hydrolase
MRHSVAPRASARRPGASARGNWLARAVVAAAAISVPVTAVTGPVFASPVLASTAQAATVSGQHTASVATATKVRTLKLKPAAAKATARQTFNSVAASLARTLVGDRYVSGGTSPAGFDCSGLTQYVYRHTGGGKPIQRTSQAQFLQFKRIGKSAARPGDLVFFHDTSNPGSYVYHVGVYEGGNNMVAATTPSGGVMFQSFTWAGDTITFGTITH